MSFCEVQINNDLTHRYGASLVLHVHVFRSRQTSLTRRSYAADFLSIKCVLFSWGKAPSLGPIPVFFTTKSIR